jgi:HAD superfamily hydrolase (TIGR01490 family)
MATNKPVIAAFDFDETLITRDSLPDFLRHSFPLPMFAWKTSLCIPMLVRFKLHKITNQTAKEQLLTTFLSGMSEQHFKKLCQRYAVRLNTITRPDAVGRVRWHQQQGDKVIILSASPENWITPWAKQHGIEEVVSTKLEIVDGKLTGKLATPNCHGAEKVTRFLHEHPDRQAYELYMYGDGKSDQQMFALADRAFEGTFS